MPVRVALFGRTGRLGQRLVFFMVLSSAALSTVASGVQLYLSYARDREQVSRDFEVIETSFREPLETALWTFNFRQIESILDGIAAGQNVVDIELKASSGHAWSRGTGDVLTDPIARRFELIRETAAGEVEVLGTLDVGLTLAYVNDRLWTQFLTLFVSNLAKTFLASIAMLLIFDLLVTRHLRQITRALGKRDWTETTEALRLDRPALDVADDLDRIVQAINGAKQRISQSLTELEREVSERRQAETVAVRASEVRRAFLSTMSHEVRTPLNAILGLLELIEHADIPDRQKRQAKAAQVSANALLKQLSNVLEVAQLEAKALELRIELTPIATLVHECEGLIEGAIAHSGKPIENSVSVAQDVPSEVRIDKSRVVQILVNLIDNAVRFTEVGRISLQMDVISDLQKTVALRIRVTDTGVGISIEDQSHIFERFSQVENVMTRRHGGSGLGLSICKELAALMGGRVELESTPGQGSSFALILPLETEGV
ncbi:MAG: ATP-binding protein [Pseudomonadota bacterium]